MNIFFLQKVEQILAQADDGAPIPRPRWLVLFCLHLDCEVIFNQAQHQPEKARGWSELQWGYDTIDLLPPLELETTWSDLTRIPSFFVDLEPETGPEIRMLYDMVINIFKDI